jgi:hypothetical protein
VTALSVIITSARLLDYERMEKRKRKWKQRKTVFHVLSLNEMLFESEHEAFSWCFLQLCHCLLPVFSESKLKNAGNGKMVSLFPAGLVVIQIPFFSNHLLPVTPQNS